MQLRAHVAQASTDLARLRTRVFCTDAALRAFGTHLRTGLTGFDATRGFFLFFFLLLCNSNG
jgi:hypothetical protein